MRDNDQGTPPLQLGQDKGHEGLAKIRAFDWNNRWLKGHQYEHILKYADEYCEKFGFQKYSNKTHPLSIYERPISNRFFYQDGTLYFVEGIGLGSEFGFPRVQGKKKFRWKKMNFSTNLPKKNPRVTYIVASTTNSHQINETDEPLFRMHAVIPFDNQTRASCAKILCHILEIKRHNQIDQINTCFSNNRFDFYKLFAFLHNLSVSHR